MGVLTQLFGCRDRARRVELWLLNILPSTPSAATARWKLVEVLFVGWTSGATVSDYDINSKIRARQSTRNRRGYNRYNGTDGIGRSARPASVLPKTVPRQPPRPFNQLYTAVRATTSTESEIQFLLLCTLDSRVSRRHLIDATIVQY